MMSCFGKSLAGAGFVVLNVIRVFNILALLAVIAASSVMLVKTFVVSKFFFFDAAEHVFRVVISTFLILTELPLFKPFIAQNWPLFAPRSGFMMLGFTMIFLGNSVLGNMNKEATSQSSLGLPFWQLVLASGIVAMIMGPVNILASYIFRDNMAGLTARQVRADGATASHKADVEASTPKPNRRSHYRSFFLGKRDSLPSYHSRNLLKPSPTTRFGTSSPISNEKDHFAMLNRSPGGSSSKYSQSPKSERHAMSPELSRPDLAHHPAMTTGNVI